MPFRHTLEGPDDMVRQHCTPTIIVAFITNVAFDKYFLCLIHFYQANCIAFLLNI